MQNRSALFARIGIFVSIHAGVLVAILALID
jgi:hypothetical protein